MFGHRKTEPAAPEPFGAWIFRQVAGSEDIGGVPFARLEQLCSNAGSLICGAAYAERDECRDWLTLAPEVQNEAALLARRTADGFRASLGDRANVVLAWPWDHLGTRVAWQATQSGEVAVRPIGERLAAIGGTYALMHREQMQSVFELWGRVAAGATGAATAPDLPAMGRQMIEAWRASSRSVAV